MYRPVYEKMLDLNSGHDWVTITAENGPYDKIIEITFEGRDPTSVTIRLEARDVLTIANTLLAACAAHPNA